MVTEFWTPHLLRSGLHVPGRQGSKSQRLRLLQSTAVEMKRVSAAGLIKRLGYRVRRAALESLMSAVDVVKLLSSALASTKASLKLRSACWLYTAPSSVWSHPGPTTTRSSTPLPAAALSHCTPRRPPLPFFAFRACPSVPAPAPALSCRGAYEVVLGD